MTESRLGGQNPASRNLYGSNQELLYGGLPTFMRRQFSRDLTDVDIAVLGIPFDLATSFRRGARFDPSAIRTASVDMAWWDKQFPWDFNPFNRLAIVDYGDVQYEIVDNTTQIQTSGDFVIGVNIDEAHQHGNLKTLIPGTITGMC